MTVSTSRLLIATPFPRSCKLLLESLAQLALRFALAIPFYRSGLTKWDGFLQLSDSADALFTDEFRLHILGGAISLPRPASDGFRLGRDGGSAAGPSRLRPGNATGPRSACSA